MAYVNYENLETPDKVLEKMVEYIITRGYYVVQNLTDDLNIYDRSSVDGKKFVFMDRSRDYYIILRSANGVNIFGTTDDAEMDAATPDIDGSYYGIGAIVSEGYSRTQRWYNQYNVPVNKGGKKPQCVWMPVTCRGSNLPSGETNPDANDNKYTLWGNNVVTPADTLVFHLTAQNVKPDPDECIGNNLRCVSMVFGDVYKYDNWNGGYFFSASSVPDLMKEAYKYWVVDGDVSDPDTARTESKKVQDTGILPILSSGSKSNTFLRIDIDDAPTEARQNIIWACSGTDNITGKTMSTPVRVAGGGNGVIPHYYVMQSQSRADRGRNINILNGISLEMPIYFAVRVDPDVLDNYAAVGQVIGVYYVCSLNMQSTQVYEQDYPNSGDLSQIFSFSMRRGRYGFDAYAVRQNVDDTDSIYGDVTTDTHHTYG